MAGMKLYAGGGNEDEYGYVAAYDGTTNGVLYLVSPDYGSGQAAILLTGLIGSNYVTVATDQINLNAPTDIQGFTSIQRSSNEVLRIQKTTGAANGGHVSFYDSTGRIGFVGFNGADDIWLKADDAAGDVYIDSGSSGEIYLRVGTTNEVQVKANQMVFWQGSDDGTHLDWATANRLELNVQQVVGSADETVAACRVVNVLGVDVAQFRVGEQLWATNLTTSGTSANAVHIAADGQLYEYTSSRRWKTNWLRPRCSPSWGDCTTPRGTTTTPSWTSTVPSQRT
jgi:hypothetical protein